MAKVTKTEQNADFNIKPTYIVATMFNGSETDDLSPLGDSYILEDVVRDTTSMSQDDNDESDIERETNDDPIYTLVTQGKRNFEAEVADTQQDLLVALAGFTYDATSNKVYGPAKYSTKYARIAVAFENADGTLSAWVYPKVQLNSKLLLESLNSNIGRISLAGVSKTVSVTVSGKTVYTNIYKDLAYTLPTGS